MRQSWRDLLFAHWDADPERVPVPRELELDTWGGRAWITVTPHRIAGIRLRGLPALPRLSAMRELSVRTYVNDGVLFTRLDTDNRLAITVARRLYRIRYRHAQIALRRTGDEVAFSSPGFRARYRAHGGSYTAAPGTLEHFLVERRVLYVADAGRVYRCDVECAPWRLRAATAEIEHNDVAPQAQPQVQFAERQDVLLSPLERVA